MAKKIVIHGANKNQEVTIEEPKAKAEPKVKKAKSKGEEPAPVVEEAKPKKPNTISEEENKAFQEQLRVDTQLNEDLLNDIPEEDNEMVIENQVDMDEPNIGAKQ